MIVVVELEDHNVFVRVLVVVDFGVRHCNGRYSCVLITRYSLAVSISPLVTPFNVETVPMVTW